MKRTCVASRRRTKISFLSHLYVARRNAWDVVYQGEWCIVCLGQLHDSKMQSIVSYFVV
jgi:hypothetical protein